VAAGLPASAE
jgi:hypothetical protein